ncbi:MAG: TolC family protein [Dictyoglomus sp.]
MKIKILIVLFVIISLWGIGYSQNQKVFTFDEAFNIALQNNKDLLSAKISLDNAGLEYENKKKDPTTLTLALKQAELNYKLEAVRYENTKLQVMQNVRTAYFNVLEAQSQVKLYKKQLEYYSEYLNATKIKFELGNATSVDVQQAEINYYSAQNSLTSAENNLEIAWSQFWQVLGVFPMKDVVLQELELKVFNLDLEKLFDIAQENLSSIVQAKNNVELYEMQVKLYDNDYTPKATLISAKNSLETAKMTLEQTLTSTRLSLAQKIEQVRAALKEVNLQRKNLDLAQENYRIAKIRYDAGLITKLDLINSEVNIIKAENSYYSSLHNYWKSLDSLLLSIGKVVVGEEK